MPTPGRALRDAVAAGPIQIFGAPNALAARLLERSGLDAMYLSGAAFSAGTLGIPDIGLFTLTELAEHARQLTRSADIPLLVDADTGFGEPLNVQRTVAELEWAGVAGIQLEDQQLPKRCGHLPGKEVVAAEVMGNRLRAACAARSDPDLVIVARTDARAEFGIDEAIERAHRYLDAGADWIFPEALLSLDEFARFAEQVDAPLMANMTEFGKSPLLDFTELAELGYVAVLYPVTLLRVGMRAMQLAVNLVLQDGNQSELLDLMQTREELYELLDYDTAVADADGELENDPSEH